MYDAIQAQPATFAEVARRVQTQAEQVASSELARAARIFLVGTGTSSHAAQIGYYLLRNVRSASHTPHIQALPAFDFALYGPTALSERDCVIVISHRGVKRYSLDAIKQAREANSYTLLITGQGNPASVQYAHSIFKTTEQDKSSAHTVSYTGTLAVLSTLAVALHQQANFSQLYLQSEFPALLSTCLQSDLQMKELAQRAFPRRRIWFVGGGPSGVTAQEAALKVKETSYLQAEGLPTETMLHGPFQCVEPEDLFVLIAPAGPAQERTMQLGPMIREIGAEYLVIDDGSARKLHQSASGVVSVPPVPEPLTALTCVIPLQFFAYYLALARGTDPDGFRKDDPRFAAASGLVQL